MHRPTDSGLLAVACAVVVDDGAGGGQHQSGVDRLSFSYRSESSRANFEDRRLTCQWCKQSAQVTDIALGTGQSGGRGEAA